MYVSNDVYMHVNTHITEKFMHTSICMKDTKLHIYLHMSQAWNLGYRNNNMVHA